MRDLSRVGARAVITPGATLDTLWPADSRIESWVMDTGTPLTNRIGVQYISFARHESHFCRRARFSSLLMLKGEFPVYQQWVTYNHQWCWAVCQACISLLRLPELRAKRKTDLKVKCFKEAFNWFKMNLVSWCKNQGEVPGGGSPPAFGSVSVEAIQETSEIFILTNIDGQILDYQQWLTCNHQWYWAATSCPETGT